MRPVVLLWSCLMLPGFEALKGPKDISGFEGDTVSLKCTYGKEERESKKYWCKQIGFLVSRCSSTIYSGEDGQEITQGRVSICDNPQELAFTVTLRDLTLQDAGKYWCGADKLGFDETFLVSLTVFPGPCCPPSPTLFLQPLSTASLQPQAKARQTQPPALTPPDLHLAVTTAKQGKTGTEASSVTGTVPFQHAGTTTHTGTSPYAGTSAHTATSPHAGSSRPPMPLDSTLAEDTSPVPISHSSRSRVSIPMVRILAPVLVLLSLLLAAGLIASGSLLLRWRKKAQLALETQKNEKVHLPTLPLGNSWVLEEAVINLSGPTEPLTSLESSASPYKETLCLNQTTEELEAPSLDPMESTVPEPLPLMSEEELGFSKFISV
ncbi:CMRF35-like molecule 9 isoform 2-T2 [Callospermophilus lateralis]|uniref:CMRF35-like molecule 9 isoform X2 n=1 Tax=Callospermophilus lateralis TaxID=76772 RepID=UPI004053C0C7